MLRHLKYYILSFRFFNSVISLKTSILRTNISAYQKNVPFCSLLCEPFNCTLDQFQTFSKNN